MAAILDELRSAISSLNILPAPIDGVASDAYLSERDAHVKHAMAHLQATLELLQQALQNGYLAALNTSDMALIFRACWDTQPTT